MLLWYFYTDMPKGRYNIGTITETKMPIGNKQTDRRNQYDECPYRSRDQSRKHSVSSLGINREINLRVVRRQYSSTFEIPLQKHYNWHSKTVLTLTYKRKQLESCSALASAKSQWFGADLYVQFRLSQTEINLEISGRNPMNQQYASITFLYPSWGRGKGCPLQLVPM